MITNPNDEVGSINIEATAVDEQDFGMSGHNYLVNGGAVVFPHETVAVIDHRPYPERESLPYEFLAETTRSWGYTGNAHKGANFDGPLMQGGMYPHWYVGSYGEVNWGEGINVDPFENAFFSIDDSWIYVEHDKPFKLGWVCQDEVSLEQFYARLDSANSGLVQGHPPTFSRFPEITHVQIAIGEVIKLEPNTKIMHPSRANYDDLGAIIYGKDDLRDKCHTWEVYPE